MIWVGTGPPSDSTMSGLDQGSGLDERRLASDWAVAMPSRGVSEPVSGMYPARCYRIDEDWANQAALEHSGHRYRCI